MLGKSVDEAASVTDEQSILSARSSPCHLQHSSFNFHFASNKINSTIRKLAPLLKARMKPFELNDGSGIIPWLAFGSGSGEAQKIFKYLGPTVLDCGFRHIDTAQAYGDEQQEAEVVFYFK